MHLVGVPLRVVAPRHERQLEHLIGPALLAAPRRRHHAGNDHGRRWRGVLPQERVLPSVPTCEANGRGCVSVHHEASATMPGMHIPGCCPHHRAPELKAGRRFAMSSSCLIASTAAMMLCIAIPTGCWHVDNPKQTSRQKAYSTKLPPC